MTALVAGFGNIFLSDDGLGSAVVRMLADVDLGRDVRVRDFGTGGMYLALEMLTGYDLVVIVDAIARADAAGTVFAMDCSDECRIGGAPAPDAHAMDVGSVLALYARLREQSGVKNAPRVVVVGCVPQSVDEGMELSEPIRAALPACVDLVRKLTQQGVNMGAKI